MGNLIKATNKYFLDGLEFDSLGDLYHYIKTEDLPNTKIYGMTFSEVTDLIGYFLYGKKDDEI